MIVFWGLDCRQVAKKLSMSAATLMQEPLSLEGANPCQFLVLYEDAVTHDAAMEVCGRLLARFETELAFTFSFRKFKDLDNPTSAHWATEALAQADIILFSLAGRDLPLEAASWLDSCVQARTKTEGALALIITGLPGAGLAVEALLSRMQFAAHRLRMDFLPLLPPLPATGIGVSADPFPALLHEALDEPGSNHWGLNE